MVPAQHLQRQEVHSAQLKSLPPWISSRVLLHDSVDTAINQPVATYALDMVAYAGDTGEEEFESCICSTDNVIPDPDHDQL